MNVDSDEMLYLKDIETVKRAAPEIKMLQLIFSIGEHCELIQKQEVLWCMEPRPSTRTLRLWRWLREDFH